MSDKNVHLEHVEDLVFNEGVAGTRKAINFLRDLRDMLSGSASGKLDRTVKWDGAPAVFAGVDPRDDKFFVAKKGVFNKFPKIYKTLDAVDEDTSGDLATKLKTALEEFRGLGITSGVYQGDLMFTDDKREQTINGVRYVTFQPNTIVYAVPLESDLGQQIKNAKIGVVWHTTYTGDSFETMRASFGKSIVSRLNKAPKVWMTDATYEDVSGKATFTSAETTKLTGILSKVGTIFQRQTAAVLNDISSDPDLLLAVKTFNNSKIRQNQAFSDAAKHTRELYDWIHAKYQKEIESRKTAAGKQKQEEARAKVLAYFDNHPQKQIADVFEIVKLLTDAKQMVVDKMNEASSIDTFLRTNDGFRITSPEGYVAIDKMSGGAVKIVDRMEFSYSNFSPDVLKGWQR